MSKYSSDEVLTGIIASHYVFVSSDGGANWSSTALDTEDNTRIQVVDKCGDGSRTFASNQQYLYLSTDDGETWEKIESIGNNVDGEGYWYVVSVSYNGLTVVAVDGADGHVWASSDGGVTWEKEYPVDESVHYWYVSSMSGDGNTFVVGMNDGRLYVGTSNPNDLIGAPKAYCLCVISANSAVMLSTRETVVDGKGLVVSRPFSRSDHKDVLL